MPILELFQRLASTQPSFTFFNKQSYRRSGAVKIRHIGEPNDAMTQLHKELCTLLAPCIASLPPSVVGSRKKFSVIDGVRLHAGNPYIYSFDIHHAYQHVQIEELMTVLVSYDLVPQSQLLRIRWLLEAHCFDPYVGGLITGAPSSSDLFNLYAHYWIDRHLTSALAAIQEGIVYSRYVDDGTISSPTPLPKAAVEICVKNALSTVHMRRSPGKCSWHDVSRETAVINGVGIDSTGRTFLPRPLLREYRWQIDRWDGSDEDKLRLLGYVHWFEVVTDRPYEEMNSTEQEFYKASRFLNALPLF